MILTQSYADLGKPEFLTMVGPYAEEVELTTERGYGLSFADHVAKLNELSGDLTIINAKFSAHPGSSHPSYGTVRVRVVGDLCSGKL